MHIERIEPYGSNLNLFKMKSKKEYRQKMDVLIT